MSRPQQGKLLFSSDLISPGPSQHPGLSNTGSTLSPSKSSGHVPQLVHRNYRCKQCNFSTTRSKLFLAHQQSIHGDSIKIYPCDICEYASKYKSKLIRHRNLKHKDAQASLSDNIGPLSHESAKEILSNAAPLHMPVDSNSFRFIGASSGGNVSVQHSPLCVVPGANDCSGANGIDQDYGLDETDEENYSYRYDLDAYDDSEKTAGQIYVKQESARDYSYSPYSSVQQDMQGDSLQATEGTVLQEGVDMMQAQQEEGSLETDGSSFTCNLQEEDTTASEDAAAIKQTSAGTDNAFHFITQTVGTDGRIVCQCNMCNYSNPQKWKVANHVRSFHMKEQLFKCLECDFATGRKIELCVHKAKMHATTKVFSCVECSYCTISRTNYERHIQNHVSGGPIKCSYCSYSSTGEAAVIRHMQEYHPKQPMTTKSPNTSQTHMANQAMVKSDHQSSSASISNGTKYSSSLFMHSFSSEKYSPLHQLEKSSKMDAIAHVRSTPKILDALSLTRVTPTQTRTSNEVDCPVCKITFRTEARLKIHMVSHSEEASHHCPLCTLKYKRTSDLNRHMKKKHGTKLSDFMQSSTNKQEQPLNLSLKSPEPEKPPKMPMELSLRNSVSVVSVEDGEQPLDLSMKPSKPAILEVNHDSACHPLQIVSPSRSSHSVPTRRPPPVVSNSKTQYTQEELKCKLCSYVAKWPSDLRRHLLVHSVEKRYACNACDKRYKYQFDLNMHLRRHHHLPVGRPRVSNVMSQGGPQGGSQPTRGSMTLPTRPSMSPPPLTVDRSSPAQSVVEKKSPSVHKEEEQVSSSMMLPLSTLLLPPSPPPPPIQVPAAHMEVVFAPSSIHDMEHTLPPSMQRPAEPNPEVKPVTPESVISSTGAATSASKLLPQKVAPSAGIKENPVQSAVAQPAIVKAIQATALKEETPSQPPKVPPPAAKLPPPSAATVIQNHSKPPPPPLPTEHGMITPTQNKPIKPMKTKALKPQRPSSLTTAARKFKCNYCPYKGLYQSEVDRHSRLHTGEKPYGCLYCEYRSAWKGDMKRHVIKHHPAQISIVGTLEKIIEMTCQVKTGEVDDGVMQQEEGDLQEEEGQEEVQEDRKSPAGQHYTESLQNVDNRKDTKNEDSNNNSNLNMEHLDSVMMKNNGHRTIMTTEGHQRNMDTKSKENGSHLYELGRQTTHPDCENLDFRRSQSPQDSSQSEDDMPLSLIKENNNQKISDENIKQMELSVGESRQSTEEISPDLMDIEKRIQYCDLCPFICEAPSKMKCHMEVHENIKRYKCFHCGKRSNWFWDVRKHIRKEHNGLELKVITMPEEEARNTLQDYINSPLFRTLSKNNTNPNAKISDPICEEGAHCMSAEDESGKEIYEGKSGESEGFGKDNGKREENEELADKILKEYDFNEEDTEKNVKENVKEKEEKIEKEHNGPETMEIEIETNEDEENNNILIKVPVSGAKGKKYRPYKCAACPRRSNWRWDIRKHIRRLHPGAKMITLSEEVAKATFSEAVMKRPKGQGIKKPKRKYYEEHGNSDGQSGTKRDPIPIIKIEQLQRSSAKRRAVSKTTSKLRIRSPSKSPVRGSPSKAPLKPHQGEAAKNIKVHPEVRVKPKEREILKQCSIPLKKRKLDEKFVGAQNKKSEVSHVKDVPIDNSPPKKREIKVETIRCKPKHQLKTSKLKPGDMPETFGMKADFSETPVLRNLKRYKCYYCPYRSNYRSDIGRHGKRLHRKHQLKVIILDEEEAASTLHEYKTKYAKKKFVLNPNDEILYEVKGGKNKPKKSQQHRKS